MANTITLTHDATFHPLPEVSFDLGVKSFADYLGRLFKEALYPDVHPDHLNFRCDYAAVQACVNATFSDAITDALRHKGIIGISDATAKVAARNNTDLQTTTIFLKEVTLTLTHPMDEDEALKGFTDALDVDAANLVIEGDMTNMARGHQATTCGAVVDVDPACAAWVQIKRSNPDLLADIAKRTAEHFGGEVWKGAWPKHSDTECLLHWLMKNHPDVGAFMQEMNAAPTEPTATPEPQPTAAAEPTATNATAGVDIPRGAAEGHTPTETQQQNNTTTKQTNNMAQTTIPAGYKVAPAAEGATQEAIASQFATQFVKALSAVSPSGKRLADCDQWWTASTRPNDLPGRIIICKVVESDQTYHQFTFDCKDRHRDSFTMDEGVRYDWLSVDAMLKAFSGQANVLDCVKDACKKRLTGDTPAAPKAATKTATEPQTAAPAAPAFPKAATKTAPAAAPADRSNATPNTATPTAPATPAIFTTYECEKTPSFFYHLYGDSNTSGLVCIHKQTGEVRQHSANQTTESSRAIIAAHGMTEVSPIPDVVITALIKEGVIKTPMSAAAPAAPAEPTADTQAEGAAAPTEADTAAAEAAEREEAERKAAAEAAEKAEAEQREREAEAKAKREEEEAKRKAEEEAEAKNRAEEEKQKIAKRNATMLIRHRDYDKIRIEVELQPLTRTGNYFWGDAGTGKTHMAKQLADDLGLKFYYQGVVQMINDFKGLVDGHGRFHATAAYYAATKGGMLVLDEMDRYPEDALIWLNGLIANRYASFYVWDEELQCVSEQTITAHPDFRVVATGNTNGEGPTPLYTAAVQLDASTLDRFNFTHVDYDERVELAIAEGDAELVEFIEAFRATVRDCRFNNLVTYRAVETIHVYMKDGRISIKDALTDRIVKGMSTENQRFVANRLSDHVNTTRNKYAKAYCELANENYRAASKVA